MPRYSVPVPKKALLVNSKLPFKALNSHQVLLSKLNNTPLGPKLPVLEAIYDLVKNHSGTPNFKDTIFVCGQNLLNTTVSFFEFLIKLGAEPKNIFVVGNTYSHNDRVIEKLKNLGIYCQTNSAQRKLNGFISAYVYDVNKMWESCLNRIRYEASQARDINGIIVLDDNGYVLDCAPPEAHPFIVAIEQTFRGVELAEEREYPIINLAASAIKQWVELPLVAKKIAQKIIDKLNQLEIKPLETFLKENFVFGIIGLDQLGQEILKQLLVLGYKHFIIFDSDSAKRKAVREQIEDMFLVKPKSAIDSDYIFMITDDFSMRIINVKDAGNVFLNADIIISSMGKDNTQFHLDAFKGIRGSKILINCSSEGIEFNRLLGYIQKQRREKKILPLEDLEIKNGFGGMIKILRGGLPFVFDNSGVFLSEDSMQVTESLKAISVLQAYELLLKWKEYGAVPAQTYKLNSKRQAFIAATWLKNQPTQDYPIEFRNKLIDIDGIDTHSGGVTQKFDSDNNFLKKLYRPC